MVHAVKSKAEDVHGVEAAIGSMEQRFCVCMLTRGEKLKSKGYGERQS